MEVLNQESKEKIENAENKQRRNSFSKEFLSIENIPTDENNGIIQSSRNLNYLIKMEEKILGKQQDSCPTVLYEKIKRQSTYKGLKSPMLKIFADLKEMKNINITIDKDEEKKSDNNDNINLDDYLQIRKMPKISEEDFQLLKEQITVDDSLENIYNDVMNFNCKGINEINYHLSVGCLMPLSSLIESSFNNDMLYIEDMNNKYNLFKQYIYNYRPIKGDGNCFYRAVIFRYFEIIILNGKTDLLKNIINDMQISFNSNEVKSRTRIKVDTILNGNLVLKILLIILDLMEEKRISDAHFFYVKSIIICPSFDYGLILYFRYIFYAYIKKNENKLYLPNFPIKIGNLLPSKYETEKGEFLFNKFYYCYLLSIFTDAEKIIVYLTPFVLGINLDIIIFDDNEDEVIKNINFTGRPEYNFNDDKMFVLNIKGHYELLYSEKDNNKYKSIFKKYICNYIPNILVEENMVINEKTKTLETPNDIYFNEKDNENGKEDEQEKNNGNNISSYKYMTPSTNKYNSYFKNINYITRTTAKNQPNNNHSKTAYSVKSLKNKTRLSVNGKESSNNNSYKNNENQNQNNKITYSFSNANKSNDQNNKIIFLNHRKSDYSQNDKNKMKFINTTAKKPEKNLGTIREESNYANTTYKNSNGSSVKYTVPKRNIISSPSNKYSVQNKSNIIPNNTRYTVQNKTISKINTNNNIKNNSINRYSTPNQNMDEDFNINIDEDAGFKSNVKEPINIKSMNLAKKINEEVTKEQEINKNVNNENKPNNNNKLLSRILMSPKKNETNEESKSNDYCENKCRYCSVKYSCGNENELLPNICYDCLKEEIINQVYPCYLSYIENFANNCNVMDYKEYFNIFIQNEITICGINISIKEAITELYIKNNNKAKKPKNEMIEMNSLFKEIKKRFCIVCSNELDNNIYIIPCGCNFCSIEHIKKYFHLKNKLKDTLFYVCQCSHQYSFSDLYNLGLFFDDYRLVSLRNDVIDILNEHLSKKCCFCNRSFNTDDIVKIRYRDFEKNIQGNIILGDCNTFKHYSCKSCFYKYNRREKEFFCNVCDINHLYFPR